MIRTTRFVIIIVEDYWFLRYHGTIMRRRLGGLGDWVWEAQRT